MTGEPIEHTLILLRHAKAAQHPAPGGSADRDRPLAPRGRRDATVAGRWLRDNAGHLDLVVLSPALRVRQTWELAQAELGYTPEVREDDRLYAEPVEELLQLIEDLPAEAPTVLFVGHNPELSRLASTLSGSEVELSTSGIAVLDLAGPWTGVTSGSARLRATVTARAE
ncbi:MAG: phosphohistidine phosphatase [Pseudonocardiales bacterium]|nr:phosphohistidine phosphatase [Pseudonocardiales bacterium]MDQ1749740.1 phosphohistidine phosphatase [Pseudonocardiales bacterium]